jgi:hypothetical protein
MIEGSGSRYGFIQITMDPYPGGPKTYGSGSTTVLSELVTFLFRNMAWPTPFSPNIRLQKSEEGPSINCGFNKYFETP